MTALAPADAEDPAEAMWKDLIDDWRAFRPSKSLWLVSTVGCGGLVVLVGFSVGGWKTAGMAEEAARTAVAEARAELVATTCVARFLEQRDLVDSYLRLRNAARWERKILVVDGGWATLPGMAYPDYDAAEKCADQLIADIAG